jgi:hypothetical protein
VQVVNLIAPFMTPTAEKRSTFTPFDMHGHRTILPGHPRGPALQLNN